MLKKANTTHTMDNDFELSDKLAFMQNTSILFSTEQPKNDQLMGRHYRTSSFAPKIDTAAANRRSLTATSKSNLKRDDTTAAGHCHFLLSGTTLHGLRRVWAKESHSFRRTTWLIVLMAMCATYAFMATAAINKYVKFESSSKISTVAAESLPFPAVSVCQQNSIPLSKVEQNPDLKFWLTCFETGQHENLSAEELAAGVELLSQYNFFDLFVIDLDDLIVSCRFGGVAIACGDYFTTKVTDTSVCYTFMDHSIGKIKSELPGYPFGLRKSIFIISAMQ